MAQIIYNLAIYIDELKLVNDAVDSVFNDMHSHWAQNVVNKLVANNIINGYADNTFRPQNDITRAECVVMVSKFLGRSENITTQKKFSDLNESHWAYKLIMNAV